MKVKVNSRSLSLKLEEAERAAKEAAKAKVMKVASDAVRASPVDTGAFVESWSIVPKGSGGGRSKSSKGKPRKQNRSAIQEQHIAQELPKDLAAHGETIISSGGAVVRNRAPHGPHMQPRDRMTLGNILATVKDKNR